MARLCDAGTGESTRSKKKQHKRGSTTPPRQRNVWNTRPHTLVKRQRQQQNTCTPTEKIHLTCPLKHRGKPGEHPCTIQQNMAWRTGRRGKLPDQSGGQPEHTSYLGIPKILSSFSRSYPEQTDRRRFTFTAAGLPNGSHLAEERGGRLVRLGLQGLRTPHSFLPPGHRRVQPPKRKMGTFNWSATTIIIAQARHNPVRLSKSRQH